MKILVAFILFVAFGYYTYAIGYERGQNATDALRIAQQGLIDSYSKGFTDATSRCPKIEAKSSSSSKPLPKKK